MGVKLEAELDVPKMIQVEQWIFSQRKKPIEAYYQLNNKIQSASPERKSNSEREESSPPTKKNKVDSDASNIPETRYEKYQKRLQDTLKKQVLTMRSLVFTADIKSSTVENEELSETSATLDPTPIVETVVEMVILHPDLDDMEASEGADMSSFMNGPIIAQTVDPENQNELKTLKCGRKTRLPARYSEPVKMDFEKVLSEKPSRTDTKLDKRRPLRDLENVSQPTNSCDQVGYVLNGLKIEVGAQFTSFAQFDAVFSAWKQHGNYQMRIVSSESLKDVDKALIDVLKYKKVVYNCYYYGSHGNNASGCEARLRLIFNKTDNALRIVGLVSEHKGHGDTQEENEPPKHKLQTKGNKKAIEVDENNDNKQAKHEEVISFPKDDKIFLGASFKSYDEFDSIFNDWRTNGCHPLRIISSEALRDSDGIQDAVIRYKKITYHCYHYGSLHNKGSNGKITSLACGCEGMLRLNYIKNEEVLRITGLVAEHKGHKRDREQFNSIMHKMLAFTRAKKRDTPAIEPKNTEARPTDSSNQVEEEVIPQPSVTELNTATDRVQSKPKKEGYRFTSKSIMPIVDETAQPSAERSTVATAVLMQTLLSQKILMTQLTADPNIASDPQKNLLLEMTKLQHLQLLVQLQHLNTSATS